MQPGMKLDDLKRMFSVRTTGAGLVLLVGLAVGLAWVSNGFTGVQGWLSFGGVLLAACAGACLALTHLRRCAEQTWGQGSLPGWLGWLVVGAAVLRLGAGVLWFSALPAVGYDTPMQRAGYVMEDAHRRDQAAWALAQSGEPLLSAFTQPHLSDQYGGLLFFSALVYRFLGAGVHQPLLMVVLTAAASALTVAYTWALTRSFFGEEAARWAAWGLALYPEAVLLGSTQMREPFLMALAAAAVWGLAHWNEKRSLRRAAGVGIPLALMAPLSPPMAAITLVVLACLALPLLNVPRHSRWFKWGLAGAGVLVVAALAGLALGAGGQVDILASWVRQVAQWQAGLTFQSSGWVQKILRSTPEWVHLPFLLGYGVLRPLLPAALIATGAPIWKGIAIWRALGWTLLLAGLLYAPLRAARFAEQRRTALAFALAAWLVVLITSFWGGGDDWDNPRYRAAFAAVQVALAAWAFASQRRQPDPWLKHLLASGGIFLLWVALWYLKRYWPAFAWPVTELSHTVALGAGSAIVYLAAVGLVAWRKRRNAR